MTATNRHGLPYEPHHAHPKPSDCHDQTYPISTASVRYRYAYSQLLCLNPNVGVACDYLPISKLYKKRKGIDETSNHKDVSDTVLLTQTCQNNRKHLLSILVTVNTLIKSAGGH